MSFDREGYFALQRAAGDLPGEPDTEHAFKFLLDSLAEQRLAIRALNDRVKALEESRSGDERYAQHAQDHDDPSALEVW
jgi:hypothetical protein